MRVYLLSKVHRGRSGTRECVICESWKRNTCRVRVVADGLDPRGVHVYACSGCLREAGRVATEGRKAER